MPPVLTILIGSPLYLLAHVLFESHYADALMAGTYFGYICYDMVHYSLHHSAHKVQHLKEMKSYHFKHHYKQADLGYGITSKVWDRVSFFFISSARGCERRPNTWKKRNPCGEESGRPSC